MKKQDSWYINPTFLTNLFASLSLQKEAEWDRNDKAIAGE